MISFSSYLNFVLAMSSFNSAIHASSVFAGVALHSMATTTTTTATKPWNPFILVTKAANDFQFFSSWDNLGLKVNPFLACFFYLQF